MRTPIIDSLLTIPQIQIKNKGMPPTKKILMVRPDAMGDVVLMIPLLNTLKATWPEAEIHPLLQGYTQDILNDHPSVTSVILDWKKAGKVNSLKDFFAYARYLKTFQFDIAILPFLEDFYVFLCVAAGIPIRVGDGNKPLIRPFLTHTIPLQFRNLSLHEAEQQARLFQALVPSPNWDMRMNLVTQDAEEIPVKTRLTEAGWRKEPLIGIHTSTGGGNRAWTASQFSVLIDLIHTQTPYRVVLTGASPKECEKVQAIIDLCAIKPFNMAGKTSTSQLKTLISQCEAFIGTDTGPVHVAAALQKPVVGLSPTKYIKSLRWGPWQTPHRVVGYPEHCDIVCNPFVCQLPHCLDAIPAQNVFGALIDVLKNPQIQPLQKNKRDWFKASVTLGFYISEHAQLPLLAQYQKLYPKHKVFTCRADIAALLGKKTSIVSPWQIKPFIRMITQHDIGVLHRLPPVPKGPWTVIKQIAALSMYAPPIMVEFTEAYSSESDLIDRYLKEFEHA